MSLHSIDTTRIKAHTAAQLIVLGYSREEVAAGFSEQEQVLLDDMITAMHFHLHTKEKPAASVLGTTDWLQRRIALGITTEDSSKLVEYVRMKKQLDPDATAVSPRHVAVPEVHGWKFRAFLKKLVALLV